MKRCWKLSVIFFAVSLFMQVLARFLPGMGQWYAVHIYPLLVGTLGRLSGLVPFSVAEIGFCLLFILCIVYGIRHIKQPMRILSGTVLLVAVLFFLYTVNCGINYYRQPFSSYLGYGTSAASEEELRELCQYLTEKVNSLVEERDFEAMKGQADILSVKAMHKMGEEYPQLSGYYPRPKGLLFSYILSIQQLTGIYLPFTIEANYNREIPEYNIPLTVCHELSHLKGFMREDEANFIGYLACIGSDSTEFQYGGYLLGWIYASNSLANTDPAAYSMLYQQLDPRVKEELLENERFWERYEGKIAEASTQMNDTYLKINDQQEGVKSYGRVTDLLLSYYRSQGK